MDPDWHPVDRYNRADYPEAVTRAEKFVDDVTFLRMARFRMPMTRPAFAGITSVTLKTVHLADANVTTCIDDRIDLVAVFPDNSTAIRIAATQRWEVSRRW